MAIHFLQTRQPPVLPCLQGLRGGEWSTDPAATRAPLALCKLSGYAQTQHVSQAVDDAPGVPSSPKLMTLIAAASTQRACGGGASAEGASDLEAAY